MDEQIAQLCEDSIRDELFPGCVVGYLRDGEVTVLPFGNMTYDFVSPAVTTDTVYDIGSITKSVPTSCLVLHLIERGLLALNDHVITYIPEISDRYRDKILVKHLLTYTVVFEIPGGLSQVAKETPQQILENLFSARLLDRPGRRHAVSNPPAVLMGLLVERITNMPLNDYANEVFGTLDMDRTSFSSGWVGVQAVAPTEIDWRGELQGVPHDQVAWVLRQAGKVAGHAGLFTTAPDLLLFASMLLNEGSYNNRQYFSPATVKAMRSNQTHNSSMPTGLGWDLNRSAVMGSRGSKHKFGATGTTGCAMIMDPVSKRAMVQLSNRTYPRRKNNIPQLQDLHRRLCDVVFG